MLTAAQIQALLVELLVGAAGGEPDRWRKVIGDVTVYPLATHPTCNWRVAPDGTDAEVAAAHLAIDLVREEHPHVGR